jgi:hypothetical protein
VIQKIIQMRAETKYSTLSFIFTFLVILLHSIHWLLAPLMLGVMEVNAHHHSMEMNMNMDLSSSASFPLLKIIFLLLNGVGIFFAFRLLWSIRRERRKGLPAYLYGFISVASLVIAIISISTL